MTMFQADDGDRNGLLRAGDAGGYGESEDGKQLLDAAHGGPREEA